MITVVGYGSLLSERSARETAPSLSQFRLVEIPGFKRIFNKVGIVFFEMGDVDGDSVYLSSCATRRDPAHAITCAAFECTDDDFLQIYEREHRFWWVEVEMLGGTTGQRGRMCTEFNDVDYRLNKCITDSAYFDRVGKYYSGKIWRNDILPNKRYLAHCLKAARSQGQHVYDNFVDSSFLADGNTSIRQYLINNEDALDDRGYSYNIRYD